MSEQIAPLRPYAIITESEREFFAAKRARAGRICYRLSHERTERKRAARPANNATDINATEY